MGWDGVRAAVSGGPGWWHPVNEAVGKQAKTFTIERRVPSLPCPKNSILHAACQDMLGTTPMQPAATDSLCHNCNRPLRGHQRLKVRPSPLSQSKSHLERSSEDDSLASCALVARRLRQGSASCRAIGTSEGGASCANRGNRRENYASGLRRPSAPCEGVPMFAHARGVRTIASTGCQGEFRVRMDGPLRASSPYQALGSLPPGVSRISALQRAFWAHDAASLARTRGPTLGKLYWGSIRGSEQPGGGAPQIRPGFAPLSSDLDEHTLPPTPFLMPTLGFATSNNAG